MRHYSIILPFCIVQNKLAFVMNMVCKVATKSAVLLLAGIVVLFSIGCSTFNRDWKKAAQTAVAPESMEGRWQGHWLSDVNGHNGKLLCIVSRDGFGDYQARFKATYQKVFKFSYTVPLTIDQTNGVWHFTGEENLGKLAGGVYEYAGTATLTNFHSTYRSKYDHDVFEMKRPECNETAVAK